MTPVHPSQLHGTEPGQRPPVVMEDRACEGCGYNLRGIALAGRCPECGAPIRVPAAPGDPLSRMPLDVIRGFRLACWLALGCVAALMVLIIVNRAIDRSTLRAILLALAILWNIAAWLLTPVREDLPQARREGFVRRGRLRRAARWLQAGWLVAAGSALAIELLPSSPTGDAFRTSFAQLEWIGLLAGLLGLICLCILLQHLADWACDREAAAAFNVATWGLPVATVLYMTIGTPWIVIAVVLAGLLIISLGAIPYALFSLTRSISWSVIHAHEYRARLVRRQERAEKFEREVAESVERMDRG